MCFFLLDTVAYLNFASVVLAFHLEIILVSKYHPSLPTASLITFNLAALLVFFLTAGGTNTIRGANRDLLVFIPVILRGSVQPVNHVWICFRLG